MIGIDTGALKKKIEERAQGISGYKPPVSIVPNPAPGMTSQPVNQPVIQQRAAPTASVSTMAPPDAGTSASEYINRKTEGLNNGQDPGYSTEAGKLYADRVTNGLKTPDASSVNAQATEDTAASRRDYMARMTSGEALGQSSFAPGSAQATRIQDQSRAGVNAANQAGQSSVNSYIRQRTEDNMTRANNLDNKQYDANRDILGDAKTQDQTNYNRGRDTVADTRYASETAYKQGQDVITNQHWDTTNSQNQAQLAIENATVAKGSDETAKRNIINSLPDGPAKNKITAGLANGTLDIKTALDSVLEPGGAVKAEYRGIDPATAEVQGSTKKAEAWVSETTDLQPGTADYLAKVRQRLIDTDATVNKPIADAKVAADNKTLTDKISKGETLTPDEVEKAKTEKIIPAMNSSGGGAREITSVDGAAKYLQDHPDGNVIIDGKNVKLIAGGRYSSAFNDSGGMQHKSFAQLQVDGKDYWMNEDGLWYDVNPISKEFNGRLTGDHWSIPNPLKK